MVQFFVAVCEQLSVTLYMKVKLPAVVGVPEIWPFVALSDSPLGNDDGGGMDHV